MATYEKEIIGAPLITQYNKTPELTVSHIFKLRPEELRYFPSFSACFTQFNVVCFLRKSICRCLITKQKREKAWSFWRRLE